MITYIVRTDKKSWTFTSSKEANNCYHKLQKYLKRGSYVSLTKFENETEVKHRFYYKEF